MTTMTDGKTTMTITKMRVGKYISVQWPETRVWYDAKVLSIDAKARTAKLWYPDSLEDGAEDAKDDAGETENINLEEAILDDEVSWPVFRDEEHAAQMMERRNRKEIATRHSKPAAKPKASSKAERERKAALEEEEKIRNKVRSSVEESLVLAARETEEAGHGTDNGVPTEVAAAVEQALYALCGSKAEKDYRTRARSLMFNLKDPHNPQLRARVLASNLLPEKVVGMSPAELANKELVEWRKARERNAGEDAFLKGAALEDLVVKKDGKNEIHVELKQDEVAVPRSREQTASIEEQVALPSETAVTSQNAATVVTTADETKTAAEESPVDDEPLSFEQFAQEETEEEEEDEEEEEEEEEEEYEPEPAYEPEDTAVADEEEYDPSAAMDDEDDTVEEVSIPEGGWEGRVEIHGMPTLHLQAVPIGGEGAGIGDLLPETVQVKGRVDYKSVQSFAKQVHRSSTSRAVTLAHIYPAPSGGDKAEGALAKLVKHYRERERAGVAKTEDGAEFYFIPRGAAADKIIMTVELIPGHVPPSNGIIGVLVHPRGLGSNVKQLPKRAKQDEPNAHAHDDAGGYNDAYDTQYVDVPPPPPSAPAMHHAPVTREVPPPPTHRRANAPPPPPPPPPPAFQSGDLQALLNNAGALFGVQNVPPPPPGG